MTPQEIIDAIVKQGMLPLFYNESKNVTLNIVKTLYKCGIRTIEYTNRGGAALENFKALVALRDQELPGLALGIGTVKTVQDARNYIAAKADYIIAPIVNVDVARIAAENNIPWIPGCMTPTEISTAQAYHAPLIKIFPANILGPQFISAIKELFPGQYFMPTGGVTLEDENLKKWFQSGVVAVGMGSKLISKSLMEQEDYAKLETLTYTALEMVKRNR